MRVLSSAMSRSFAIENEWYWRISENAKTFDAPSAARDFLAPLARVANDIVAITDIAADEHDVTFVIGADTVTIRIDTATHDRVAINHFVLAINGSLASTKHAFALVSPKRYELRGMLLTQAELADLVGKPELMMPSGRPSWRSMPTQ
jgi:hypothetical protein